MGVAFVALAGCGRFGFDERAVATLDADIDAFDPCAAERVDLGDWGAPSKVAGINATQHDDDPAPRFDDLELIWGSNRAGSVGLSDLWRVTRASTADAWGPVEHIAELATTGNENTPGLSSDGLELFFSSNRSGSQQEDIWMTRRSTLVSAWDPPTRVVELSSSSLDRGASLWNNDLGVVFHSDRAGPSEDLYVATRATRSSPWSPPVLLVPPSTSGSEMRGWLSPCGLELTFQSGSRAVSNMTFYVMTRATIADEFTNERELSTLNSPLYDEDLQILPNRRHAYFSTQREGGPGEIYESFR